MANQKITIIVSNVPEEAVDNLVEWACESIDSMLDAYPAATIDYRIEG